MYTDLNFVLAIISVSKLQDFGKTRKLIGSRITLRCYSSWMMLAYINIKLKVMAACISVLVVLSFSDTWARIFCAT